MGFRAPLRAGERGKRMHKAISVLAVGALLVTLISTPRSNF
jgi:hypothetical protein